MGWEPVTVVDAAAIDGTEPCHANRHAVPLSLTAIAGLSVFAWLVEARHPPVIFVSARRYVIAGINRTGLKG